MAKGARLVEAAWAPGLDSDIDPDDSLRAAFEWLRKAERSHGGRGVLVMNAASMRRNRPLLETAPWDIVSPRSRRTSGRGPVLAIWPTERTLELAEMLATGSALCVIGATLTDISPWIRRTGATCIVEGYAVRPADELPAEVTKSLDEMVAWGGHNSFLGPTDKTDAIRRLRAIAARPDAPSRQGIESYLRASGKTDSNGAARAGKWYDEIRHGTRHRDYRGQTIR
jgi:hypothetical protein